MGRRCLGFAALVVASAFSLGVPAQADDGRPLRFRHLGVDEGLSHTWAHAALRDSRGFLWVATEDGLNRYDGRSIVVHRTRLGDVHSLAASQVRSLFEDDRKRLWVGAETLHLYDRKRDRFERYRLGTADHSQAVEVRAIRTDAGGQVWVGTNIGLFRVDPATGASVEFRHDPADASSLGFDEVVALLFDRRGQLWVGTRRGLNRYDAKTGRFIRLFQGVDAPAWLKTANIETMIEDEQGTLWIGTMDTGLVRVRPETGEVKQYMPDSGGKNSISGNRVLSLAPDGKGRLYVGLESAGLDVLEMASGRLTHYGPDPEDPASLSSSSVFDLRFDHQGILWLATFNGGIDYVSPFGQRFGVVTARRGELSNPHVLALLEDYRGDLWIGTDGGGLTRWDRRSGAFVAYRHDPRRPDGLSADAVLALHEDAEHNIWVGTWGTGLDRLDPRTGRFEHHRNRSNAVDSVWTISEDGRGNLLLGTWGVGAQEFSRATGKFRALAELYPGVNPSGQVLASAVDSRGNLWLGEQAGALYVDRTAGTATRLRLPLGAPQAFLLDSRGTVWIGTDTGGLYCLGADREPRRRYTVEDGLPSDNVGTILEDESGNLWIGTTRGIAQIEDGIQVPAKLQVRRFDVQDGLQGSEFKRGAGFRSSSGEMFFGGQRGFNYFYPKNVQKNPHVPAVVLTDLQLFNQSVAVGTSGSPLATTTITEAESLTLSYRDSVVTFEFAALDFVLPSKNQYKYKLEGFDTSWNVVGTRRLATYTNLPPGGYTLRVAGSNNDGVWNEDGVRLPMQVVPPFWRTPLFQSMMALSLLGMTFAAHRWRLRQHLLAERVLKERIQEALAEIKTLTGLLPMCAWCKKIRDDDGRWVQVEAYVKDHTQADFTHGICPDCKGSMLSPELPRARP